jgi:glycerol-3-phosphate O-acyltransferase
MRIAVAAVVIAALALIAFVFGKRHARRLQHARRIRIDRYKLKRRHAEIELEVFGSREVVHAVQRYAKDHHVSVEEARAKARQYLFEIVPKFNLLAYYRFGQPVARGLLYFLYRVVVERKPMHAFNDRAQRGTVVYIINHRSNADYVLVAHMLFRFISLSYAVGEWARVWPLNHLFKWFGAYFIRRRYREPLYHAVLSTFVQTITKNGVTQGIFIEGGLTRDGAFQKPKLGMLDYIVTAKRDPEFREPLWLIPTSINYDRVLEDRHLTEELMGIEERSTKLEKLRTTFDYLFRNALRSLFRRFKRYGYAIVTFGAPLLVDDFIREHPAAVAETFEERKPELTRLAEEVMMRISDAIPVTPVTLAAHIFRDQTVVSEGEMIAAMERQQRQWHHRVWLLREKTAEDIWRAAKDVVLLRHLVVGDESGWRWNESELPLRDYYANSLLRFDEVKQRGWPDTKKQSMEVRVPAAS